MGARIAVVAGTRPEAIKLIPVYEALKTSSRIIPVFIATGQHKDMLSGVFDAFGFQSDISMDVMAQGQPLGALMARLLSGLEAAFMNGAFDLVVVQGDTSSAFAAALAAHYAKIPVAHVEAGLRTLDKWSPFPEETHRRMIGAISDYHFAATEQAAQALEMENVRSGVYVVGNTVIDALLFMRRRVLGKVDYYRSKMTSIRLSSERYILVTTHRRENFGAGMENICAAVATLADRYEGVNIIVCVHLNPVVKEIVHDRLGKRDRVYLVEPLPYDEMVFLMMGAWLILTDSGGLQEEAPSLNVPILVLRDKTERPEGVASGCARLVGTDPRAIVSAVDQLWNDEEAYRGMTEVTNPYGDGLASGRIVSVLEENLLACR